MDRSLQGLKKMDIPTIFTRMLAAAKRPRPGRADASKWEMLSTLLESQAMTHGMEGSEMADTSSELELKAIQLVMRNSSPEGPKGEGQSG
jgi:hypothetical protein